MLIWYLEIDCELFCFILNLFDSACGTIGDGNFNKTVEIFCEHDEVFVGFDETVDSVFKWEIVDSLLIWTDK